MSEQQQIVILLGAPGSGKGTQAARLSAFLSVPAISTGEILRREAASGSELGRVLKETMEAGRLACDDLMNQVVASRLAKSDCRNGFILDGYPRTAAQARFLINLLRRCDMPDACVIHLKVDAAEVVRRLHMRLQCPVCGEISSALDTEVCAKDGVRLARRADDCQAEAVAQRIATYQMATAGVIGALPDARYAEVDAAQPVLDVTKAILDALDAVAEPVRVRVAART